MLPIRREGLGLSGDPGRISAVMRAVAPSGPRRLRVALTSGGRIVEERIIAERADVSVGRSERATFVVDVPGLPGPTPIFVCAGRGYTLELPMGVSARVQAGDAILSLPADGKRRRLALGPDARGTIRLGESRLLFQMVRPVPRSSGRLPLAVLRDPGRLDWTTTLIAAFSFVAHFGVIGTMYSDWVDPVLDDSVTISGVVDQLAILPQPPEIESGPAPPEATPATPAPARAVRAQPSSGRSSPESRARTGQTAALSAALDQIELGTLGALKGRRPATDGVLSRGEVPTALLDGAAASERGVSDSSGLALHGGRTRIVPGTHNDLSSLAQTRASVRLDETGRSVRVDGPRPEALTSPPVVHGSTVNDAARVVAGLRPGFRACYKRALDERPEAAGGVRVTIQVGPGGEVQSVTTQASGTLPPSVATCVAARTRSASFGPPSGGAAVIVVPVSFILQR